MKLIKAIGMRHIGFGFLAALITIPIVYAERAQVCGRGGGGGGGGGGDRDVGGGGGGERSEGSRGSSGGGESFVERPYHGSISHVDTNVAERPAAAASRNFTPQEHVIVQRDVDADVSVARSSIGGAYGARRHRLGDGYRRFLINNEPYYYDDGNYYQLDGDDYQEVYPPVGADIAQLPDGAVEIDAGDVTYFYADGTFYVEQDGGFAVVPAPMGVTVPEPPSGAVQVPFDGGVAYQFNGTYYQPVFVNGVTQYLTVTPNPQAVRDSDIKGLALNGAEKGKS